MGLFYIIIGLLVLAAVVLVIMGLKYPQSDDYNLQERLSEFAERGEEVDLEKIELSLPFVQRVIYPMARKLGEFATRFTPQNALQSTEKKLELAGNPGKIDPTTFLALRFISGFFFAGLMILIFTFGASDWAFSRKFLIGIAMTVIGFYFPQLWLSGRITKRQKEILHSLPDALDLLTICVEAGLGFDAAMGKVCEKWDSELSRAFRRAIREVQLGKLRRDALRDMADRIGLTEMTSFVAAVIQSEALGVSMAKVLRIQSDQMRIRRRQHAEEEAHKAPIKMLIPMGLLIFPSLMVVLLTPAALRLVQSSLGAMLR